MALLIDAGRVGTVGDHLASLSGPEQARVKQQVDARVLHESELMATARQVRQVEPGPAQEQLLNRLPAADRARVQELAKMDAKTRQQAHDTALLEGDALAKRLRGETDPAERLRLAEEATYKQMLANMLNDEAYITPGAVGEFVSQKPVANASERYQASLDQVLMIGHQAHAAGGVLAAMRRYEIFKYISRYCELLESSGLVLDAADKAKLTWFKNWSEYVYRVEREATGSATAVEGRQVAGRRAEGRNAARRRADGRPARRVGQVPARQLPGLQGLRGPVQREAPGRGAGDDRPRRPGGPAGPNAPTPRRAPRPPSRSRTPTTPRPPRRRKPSRTRVRERRPERRPPQRARRSRRRARRRSSAPGRTSRSATRSRTRGPPAHSPADSHRATRRRSTTRA